MATEPPRRPDTTAIDDHPDLQSWADLHPARVWNYLGGGKDNYPPDQRVADALVTLWPGLRDVVPAGRTFLSRVVRYTASAGVRQWIDVGIGFPALQDNTHEVAHRVAPGGRVVYVDNDPLVLAHARALLDDMPVVEADARDPAHLVKAALAEVDADRPVGVLLLGLLHYLTTEQASALVEAFTHALAPGSHLAISHLTTTVGTAADRRGASEALSRWTTAEGRPVITPRTPDQVTALLGGLSLVEPGVVPALGWRPEHPLFTPREVGLLCGLARKP